MMQGPWSDGIPSEWRIKPLWSEFRREKTLGNGSEELLSVYRDYGVIPKSSREDNFNKPSEDLSKYQRVAVGDLVVNKMKAWQGSLGISNHDGIVSPAYFVYKAKGDFDRRFAHYLLRCKEYADHMAAISSGIRPNQWDLDPGQFAVTPLLVPPPAEQRAIADYLDRETAQIDAFIAKNEELITLLTERRASAVSERVSRGLDGSVRMKDSGIPWLGPVPEHWEVIRARYLCTVSTGDGDTIDAVDEGDYPFYVRSDTPQRSDRFGYDTEAVLTSGDGAGVGKVFHLVAGKFAAHQRVYVLHSFQHVSASFFYRFFATYFGVVALDGSAKSTVDSVRRHMITDMPIAVPPFDEQAAIVAAVESTAARTDVAIQTARRSVELARERRAALISAAVTGKIDVGVAA